jgi:hypothetical protein
LTHDGARDADAPDAALFSGAGAGAASGRGTLST